MQQVEMKSLSALTKTRVVEFVAILTHGLASESSVNFVFDVFHTSMEQVATLTCNNAPTLAPGKTQCRRFESI